MKKWISIAALFILAGCQTSNPVQSTSTCPILPPIIIEQKSAASPPSLEEEKQPRFVNEPSTIALTEEKIRALFGEPERVNFAGCRVDVQSGVKVEVL